MNIPNRKTPALQLALLTQLLIVIMLVFSPFEGKAQEAESSTVKMKNSEGTDFWLCFMKNFKEDEEGATTKDELILELFITSSEDASVEITIDGIDFKRKLSVIGGTVVTVKVDPSAQLVKDETVERKAVHVTSDVPISVYGLNRRYQTTDTYLGLPVSVLGKEYRVMGYAKIQDQLVSQAAIVATEDNTKIVITPSVETSKGNKSSKEYTITLNKGDVYQFRSKSDMFSTSDLTGTIISANKKISVFSGHSCAYVPPRMETCNHLVEHLPPTSSWGKHFYVGMLKGRSRYTLRVLAHEPRTKIFENSKLVAVLNAGEFYENYNVRQHLQVTADRPILVAQFSQGFKNGDSIGDPMMILVSPTQQFVDQYRIATPVNGFWDHYVNLIVPTADIKNIRLDGKQIDSSEFQVLGLSRYSIAQKKIEYGTHSFTSSGPFGLYSYGFGYKSDSFDAYGNMGGQSFFDLENTKDSLPPLGESKPTKKGFSVVFRDDRTTDKGLKSIQVLFNQGLKATIPTIEEGSPQVEFAVEPMLSSTDAKMILQAIDVSGNRTIITVCYQLDNRTDQFGFKLCPDGEDCTDKGAWFAGGYLMYNTSFHSADFSRSGPIATEGKFGTASGGGGYIGVLASRRINDKIALTAKLSLETVGGTILAPNTTIDSTKINNVIIPVQRGYSIELDAPILNLGISAEWYFMQSVYVLGGLNAMLTQSDAITYKELLLSEGVNYGPDNSREKLLPLSELPTLTTLRVGATVGAGVSIPINAKFSSFVETTYTHPFTGMLSEANGNWDVSHFNIQAGIRWRIK